MGREGFIDRFGYVSLRIEILPEQKEMLLKIAKRTGNRTLSHVTREAIIFYYNHMTKILDESKTNVG